MLAELERLPDKRRAFVVEYAKDHNATQAAIRAGYAENSAQEQSSRLLSIGMVREAVAALEAQNARECRVTVEGLTEDLRKAYKLAIDNNQTSAAVSAVQMIAKLHGLETAQRANENEAVRYVVEAPPKARSNEEWLKEAGKGPTTLVN